MRLSPIASAVRADCGTMVARMPFIALEQATVRPRTLPRSVSVAGTLYALARRTKHRIVKRGSPACSRGRRASPPELEPTAGQFTTPPDSGRFAGAPAPRRSL